MNWFMPFGLILGAHLANAAGPLAQSFDTAYSFLSGHEPNHTIPIQLANHAQSMFNNGMGRVLENFGDRRHMNSLLFQKNLGTLVLASDNLKTSAAQTYAGTGIIGAADALRQIASPRGMIRGAYGTSGVSRPPVVPQR